MAAVTFSTSTVPRDVDPAMADKDADPRFVVAHIMLQRIGLLRDEGIARRRQKLHGHGGGGAGLGHGLRDVLGFLEGAGDENTGP